MSALYRLASMIAVERKMVVQHQIQALRKKQEPWEGKALIPLPNKERSFTKV